MDYVLFSKRFFSASGIPVTLLEKGRPVYSSLLSDAAFSRGTGNLGIQNLFKKTYGITPLHYRMQNSKR